MITGRFLHGKGFEIMTEDGTLLSFQTYEALLEYLKKPGSLKTDQLEWIEKGWGVIVPWYRTSRSSVRRKSAHPSETKAPRKRGTPSIKLPSPSLPSETRSFGELFFQRRTTRKFEHGCSSKELSYVLTTGVKLPPQRTWPKAMGLYVIAFDVDGLEAGAYRYCEETNSLSLESLGNFSEKLITILMGQSSPATAAYTTILTIDFDTWDCVGQKARDLRIGCMEVGRWAQRFILAGENIGLGSFTTPAIKDSELSEILTGLSESELPMYSLTMGRRAKEYKLGSGFFPPQKGPL